MDIREDDDSYDELLRYEMTSQPFLMKCLHCKAKFDEPDELYSSEPYEFWGERGSRKTVLQVCPECGSEYIEEALSDGDEEDEEGEGF